MELEPIELLLCRVFRLSRCGGIPESFHSADTPAAGGRSFRAAPALAVCTIETRGVANLFCHRCGKGSCSDLLLNFRCHPAGPDKGRERGFFADKGPAVAMRLTSCWPTLSPRTTPRFRTPRLDLEGGYPLASHRALTVRRRILDRAPCGRFRRLLLVTTRPSAGRSVLRRRLGPSRCARGLACRRGSERSRPEALRRGVWWEERQAASREFPACG